MAPVTYAFQNIKSTKKLRNFSKLKNFMLVAMQQGKCVVRCFIV